jgi:hypothetical protein
MPDAAEDVRRRMHAWLDLVADIVAGAQAKGELRAAPDPLALATILVAANGLKDLRAS